MDDLETQCLNLFDFGILVFYVDDMFAVIPKTKISDVFTVLNDYHPRLRFTYEMENNGFINFLDTTVIHSGNNLITN